jgi:[ribosomal protein S18]-alanine N-acetyltransferase
MTWKFRQVRQDDLTTIMRLESSVFGHNAWSRGVMRRALFADHRYAIVAFSPSQPRRISGYAAIYAPIGSSEADVQTVAVAPDVRRLGLGRALTTALVDEARQRGAHDVFLEVRADNAGAQRLYAELGFEEIGIRPRYYQPDDVDAIVMRLRLAHPHSFSIQEGEG